MSQGRKWLLGTLSAVFTVFAALFLASMGGMGTGGGAVLAETGQKEITVSFGSISAGEVKTVFTVNFSEPVLGNFEEGADVKNYLADTANGDFLQKMKINGAAVSSVTDRAGLTKSGNGIRFEWEGVIWNHELLFESGLTLGDFTLSETLNYSLDNTDRYVLLEQPEPFRLVSVREKPLNDPNYAAMLLVFNRSLTNADISAISDHFTFNGKPIKDNTDGGMYCEHGDWPEYGNRQYLFYPPRTEITAGQTLAGVPAGVAFSDGVTAAQSFLCLDDTDWYSRWTEQKGVVSVTSVQHNSRSTLARTNSFTVRFNASDGAGNAARLLSGFADGDDVTDYLRASGNLMSRLKVNGTPPADFVARYEGEGRRFRQYKDGTDGIRFVVDENLFNIELTFEAGLLVDGFELETGVTYYQDNEDVYSVRTGVPEVAVSSIREVPYGNSGTVGRKILIVFNRDMMAAGGNLAEAEEKILTQFTLNGRPLGELARDSKFFTPENDFGNRQYMLYIPSADIAGESVFPKLTVPAGIDFGTGTGTVEQNFYCVSNVEWYSEWSDTFDNPYENASITRLTGVTQPVNYGIVIGQNTMRFTLHFSDLGKFANSPKGADLTAELMEDPYFYNGILINGSTLGAVSSVRTVKVFRGSGDALIYGGAGYEDAIEIQLKDTYVFEAEVTLKKGFLLGDVYTEGEVTFDKQRDDSYVLRQSAPASAKVLSVRERPYGADNSVRAMNLVFNLSPGLTTEEVNTLFSGMRLNGQPIDDREAGGKYFNPEPEFGNRQFLFYLSAAQLAACETTPTLTIPAIEGKLGAQTFVLDRGVWRDEENPHGDSFTAPGFASAVQPGNQDQGRKLVRFTLNYPGNDGSGENASSTCGFLRENVLLNGKKASERGSGFYLSPELEYGGVSFVMWLWDEDRNHDTGLDILFIPAGTPLAGGAFIAEDTRFYAVKTDREDAGGGYQWVWTLNRPDLKVYRYGDVTKNAGSAEGTIRFDRPLSGSGSAAAVNDFVRINGKTVTEWLAEGADAELFWTQDGLKFSLGGIADGEETLTVTLLAGFQTPDGDLFGQDIVKSFGYESGIWADSFETILPDRLNKALIDSVEPVVGQAGGGIMIAVNFKSLLTDESNTFFRLANVTANPGSLLSRSRALETGYYYDEAILERMVRYGVGESILDKLLVNGQSLRTLLGRESDSALAGDCIQVDLRQRQLLLFITGESASGIDDPEGMTLGILSGMVFDSGFATTKDYHYRFVSGAWSAYDPGQEPGPGPDDPGGDPGDDPVDNPPDDDPEETGCGGCGNAGTSAGLFLALGSLAAVLMKKKL